MAAGRKEAKEARTDMSGRKTDGKSGEDRHVMKEHRQRVEGGQKNMEERSQVRRGKMEDGRWKEGERRHHGETWEEGGKVIEKAQQKNMAGWKTEGEKRDSRETWQEAGKKARRKERK